MSQNVEEIDMNDCNTSTIKRKVNVATTTDMVPIEEFNLSNQSICDDENSAKKMRQSEAKSEIYQVQSNDEINKQSLQNNLNHNIASNNLNKSPLQILNDLIIYNKCKVKYDVVSQQGPPHAKIFCVKCVITDFNNTELESYTTNGTSIIKAKQLSAEQALSQTKLEKPNLSNKKNKNFNNNNFQRQQRNFNNNRFNNNNINQMYNSNNNNYNRSYQPQQFNQRNQNYFNNANFNNKNNNNGYNSVQTNSSNLITMTPMTNNSSMSGYFADGANEATNGQQQSQLGEQVELEKYEFENQRLNKRHMLVKHQQIQPDTEHINVIEYLVYNIEKNLKAISDKLLNEELDKNQTAAREQTERSSSIEVNVESKETLIGDAVAEQAQTSKEMTAKTLDSNGSSVGKENYRQLKGVFRVGSIEKGVFLKFDRDIELIALTAKMPTFNFVKRILTELEASDLFEKEMEPSSVAEDKKTTESSGCVKINHVRQPPEHFNRSMLKLDRNEDLIKEKAYMSVFYEYSSDVVYHFKISFSSMEINKNTDLSLLKADLKDTTDFHLPLQKCLASLVEIDRVKWFNNRLRPIANAMLIIRLLRDLTHRSPTWSCLGDWLVEIIVDKCCHRNKFEDITLKFRYVFECISGGVLFIDKLNIIKQQANSTDDYEVLAMLDPNEVWKEQRQRQAEQEALVKDETVNKFNVAGMFLTEQQKEDLTSSAQQALRLIAMNRVHQVLGMDFVAQSAAGPVSTSNITPNEPQANENISENQNNEEDSEEVKMEKNEEQDGN